MASVLVNWLLLKEILLNRAPIGNVYAIVEILLVHVETHWSGKIQKNVVDAVLALGIAKLI